MEIEGSKCLLRKLKTSDREELASIANNRKIWVNLRDRFPHPYSIDDADFFINLTNQEDPTVTFAIEYQGKFAGIAGFVPLNDVYRRTGEIGYWLGEPYWGNGIVTEACQLVTDYGFKTLEYVRIHTGVFGHNPASMKILEKCGYQKEAVFKNNIWKDGKLTDEHRYYILNKKYLDD